MYQIPEFLKFPKLFHAFSTKADGNMANSILGRVVNFDEVISNREKFLSKVGVNQNKCICMWVVHKDEIIEPDPKKIGISMKDYKKAMKVDGLITNKKNLYLFVLIADCLPIILYDLKVPALTLVHAGWRGVDLKIAKKAVIKMHEKYGSNITDIIAGIGPSVHKESFLKENPSQKSDPKWQSYLTKIGETKYQVDLIGFVKKQLEDSGVLPKNIFVSDVDTGSDERFYSHNRDKNLPVSQQGRFCCVVGML